MQQIKWQEPAKYIRAWKRHTRTGISPARQLILFLAVAGCLMLIFGIAFVIGYVRHGFAEGWILPCWAIPAILLGVPFAIAYLIPWVSSLTNAQISVGPSGVYRTSRESAVLRFQHWPWAHIQRCRIEELKLGGGAFQVLSMVLNDGDTVSIGLSDKVDRTALAALVRSRLESSGSAQRIPDSF